MLARTGLEVEEVRPDAAGARLSRRPTTRSICSGRRRARGGAAPCRRRPDAGVDERSKRAQPLARRAVPGSVVRHTASSRVGTEKVTETSARRDASASKSASRTISGPRVMIENGFEASRSTSRHARVRR